jgi:hypothetical protein
MEMASFTQGGSRCDPDRSGCFLLEQRRRLRKATRSPVLTEPITNVAVGP